MRDRLSIGALAVCAVLMINCNPGPADPPRKRSKVVTEQSHFRDAHARYVFLNGVNASGTAKVPVTTDPVSYVGRPFREEEADAWFAKLARDGFNSIRYIATWDAVNHAGPGIYDTDYLDYLETMVQAAGRHGIYVLINFHENLFSRHFYSLFNDKPALGAPGSLEATLASLFPAEDPATKELYYDSRVEGDGAPRWAVEACAPEKDLDHPSYGMVRLLGALAKSGNLEKIIDAMSVLLGGVDMGDSSELLAFFSSQVLKLSLAERIPFDIDQTTDMLPFTLWAMNHFTSVDVEKCYAAFFAGDAVFPDRHVDGRQIKDYLQEGHIGAWLEVVKRLKEYDNVIGYDLMNEPTGIFLILSVVSAYVSAGFDNEAAYRTVAGLLGDEKASAIYKLIDALELLPSLPLQLEAGFMQTEATDAILALVRAEADPELALLLAELPTDIGAEPFVQRRRDAVARVRAATGNGLEERIRELSAGSPVGYTREVQDGLRAMADAALNSYVENSIVAAQAGLEKLPAGYSPEAGTLVKVRATESAWREVAAGAAGEVAPLRQQMIAAYWESIRADWGLADFDVLAGLGLNMNFERNYLLRYFARLGMAIQAEDPEAIVWVGDSLGLDMLLASDGIPQTNSSMYKPDGLDMFVSTHHVYPGSIYPLGLWQVPPQSYEPQEWARRDFSGDVGRRVSRTLNSFGDVPVVFTEFGTYFNFNWNLKDRQQIQDTIARDGYEVSATILNMEYEAMDRHLAHRMVWCMSPENDYQLGDRWNHEDFSVYGPDGEPRAGQAWIRPVPRFVAGEPVAMHFHSDYHWFDPDKGRPEAWERGEFYLAYESKESDLPTEIYLPSVQYPDGFYVWLSDGWCRYDSGRQTLYHFPTEDDPDAVHQLTVRRSLSGRGMEGWDLYFDGTRQIAGPGR